MSHTPELLQYEQLAAQAMEELLACAKPDAGQIVVVGCSSSEVSGARIGTAPAPDIGEALVRGMLPLLQARGLFLAAQCCEHLNRALVVEAEALHAHGLVRVNALPRPEAGGSFATAAWHALRAPVLAEGVQAVAGIDIGSTLIGMHLHRSLVAVPVRLSAGQIGRAPVTAARTRPRFIGGARAAYDDTLL